MSTMDRIDPRLHVLPDTESMAQTMTAGISTGLIAGLVMGLVAMIHSSATGQDFTLPLKLIGATLLGTNALISDGQSAFAGLIIHLVISAMLGFIFAFILRPQASSAAATGVGIVFGIIIWATMTYLVLPTTNTVMLERIALMSGSWFILHLIFGACLGILPSLRRSYHRAMKMLD